MDEAKEYKLGSEDRQEVGGSVAGYSGGSCGLCGWVVFLYQTVFACAVHPVVRTFAVLLTGQITGLVPSRTV